MSDEVALKKLPQKGRTVLVVEQLTRIIVNGSIKTGDLLPSERELANRMGVGRNVVREAMKILQSRGLVSIVRGRGTIVTNDSALPIQQVYLDVLGEQQNAIPKVLEARYALEIQIACVAALRATNEDLDLIEANLSEFESALNDLSRCTELDVSFHRLLALATHNRVFSLMLEPLSKLLHECRRYSIKNAKTSVIHGLHRAIFNALKKRDCVLAAKEMENHMRVAIKQMRSWQVTEGIQEDSVRILLMKMSDEIEIV